MQQQTMRSHASSGRRPFVACRCQGGERMSRRQQLVGLFTATALVAPVPSHAALNLPNKEADNATNAFIQERLRRTEEKREERRVERLNDYYKRNFREYFEYEAGSKNLARRRGISDKTTDAMLKWLEENK